MIKILLLAVVPFITQHRNVAPKTEVSTNFYGSVNGIVDKAYIEARVGAGGGGCDTNAVDALANSAVVTNALTVATTNRVALLEHSKADKSALNSHVENKSNPHAVTAAQVGAVPLVNDVNDAKTAVTIGIRKDGELVGEYSFANGFEVTASGGCSHAEGSRTTAAGGCSHAEGFSATASGDSSHAEGSGTTAAYYCSHAEGSYTTAAGGCSHAEGEYTTAAGYCSHAEGLRAYTKEQDKYAFAWNGDVTRTTPYESNGPGTFNINPAGGLNGFYIGEQTLYAILTNKADKSAISATDPTFSNAVLAVQISTNDFSALYALKEAFADLPIDPVTGGISIGALLAALASAVAWLKKNKVGSFASVGGATATVENGVAELNGFFTESNTLLTATIDTRLPYPLYAVPSTGVLKDRAINTTSLASVTVPDNFTDLLVRASVSSSLAVTMPEAITKYGDTFPGEAGEYLITITKTGAAEAYVRTIKLEEVA